MDWQKVEHQTFQIMWSMKPHNDSLPPLQVRSFTSDSYRAIKERERKRSQQKKAASKQWRTTPHSKARRESASLDAAGDARQRGAELDDDIYMSDSRGLQPVAQEDSRVQSDGGTQQNLHRSSAQPTGLVEVDCEGMIRCLDASTSSPVSLGSTIPQLTKDTELGSDSSQAMDPEQSSASANEVDMIVPNDADTPVEEPGSALVNETALATLTPSHPTPIHSCVAGCSTEPYKRPMQDGDSASPRPVSSQPNTLHILAATTGPPRNEFALAKGLPDVQCYVCRDGYHGPRTYRARFDQAGGICEKRDSVPKALWTKDLDEHLLHLRNVAQLKWEDLVNYFPTMTPIAVKRRHKQLSGTKETAQGADNLYSARFEEYSTAAFPLASTSGKREPRIIKHHHATSEPPATRTMGKPQSLLRRRRAPRLANNAKVTTSPTLLTYESTLQRLSRCGRPIRHPFRHRP